MARQELTVMDVQRLLTSRDSFQRARAEKFFRPSDTARPEVVKKFHPSLNLKGSAERGHAIYLTRCASCHRTGGEGFAVGPDLASVVNGGKEKLLTSIFDPNAEVAAAYVAYSIETKSGESFLGVLAGENSSAVMLKVPNGETVHIARENISSLRASDKSLMPDGLEEGLSEQDVADLLEFVTQAKPPL